MGLLARNLRNFDEAGVPDAVADTIIARFTDPAQIAGDGYGAPPKGVTMARSMWAPTPTATMHSE
jgi:hypothetical protein